MLNKVFLKVMITKYEVNLCSITSKKFLKDKNSKLKKHPPKRNLEILNHNLFVTENVQENGQNNGNICER